MRKHIIFLVALVFCTSLFAQKVSIIKGDFNALKRQKQVMLVFDYDNVSVGKFKNEQDYVNKKAAEYNEKEKGKGDQWKEAWYLDRSTRYEPKFEELLNKYTGKVGLVGSQSNAEAEYTLIVRVKFIEPGFNVYVHRKPAMIHTEIDLVRTAEPERVLGTMSAKNMPGTALGYNDFDTGVRITEAFAKCGKEVGAFLAKKVLK